MRRFLLLGSIMLCASWALPAHAGDAANSRGEAAERAGSERKGHDDGREALDRALIHETVELASTARAAAGSGATTVVSKLTYRGGLGGVGVETAPKIYLVLWGSQWNNNDPSGERAILEQFYYGIGASSWLASVTQYCQGVKTGTTFCNGSGQAAGNPGGVFAGTWSDDAAAAPSHPSQSQFAAEAVRAASYFRNTTSSSNANAQYVIATATGNSSTGFKTQYCAYHSYASSAVGNVAYTNLPYITDAGASCGANFNGLGPKAGITIIAGHEAGETITDQFPSTGWIDSHGAENGDKCAWITTGKQGAAQTVQLSGGATSAPVQSLWSNSFNNGAGGCVVSYP